MPTGDRPRFGLAKQRLDKVDVEAISDLVQEQVLRTVGALLGPAEGFLSEVAFSYTAPYLTVSECRLAYAAYISGSTLVMDGGVVAFRPAIHPSGGQVDLTPLGGNPGYLFFKRTEAASDEENRAYFDVVAQQKKVGLTNTRFRERVDWGVANDLTTLTQATGWNLCAEIQWGGAAPRVIPIWAGEMRDSSGLPARVMRSTLGVTFDPGLGVQWRHTDLPGQSPAGILRFLQQLVGIVQHMLDRTFTLNELGQATGSASYLNRWTNTNLSRDIRELHEDLAAAEATLATAVSDVAALELAVQPTLVNPCLLAGRRKLPSGFDFREAISLSLLSHGAGGTGEYGFTFDPASGIAEDNVAVLVTTKGSTGKRDVTATYEWTTANTLTVWTYEQDGLSFVPETVEFSIAIFNTVP